MIRKSVLVWAACGTLAAAAIATIGVVRQGGDDGPSFGVAQVALAPIELAASSLVVVADDQEIHYSGQSLEALPTFQFTTSTPWRDAPARFEGVLLGDVLAAAGLADAQVIRVTAENDYAVEIPREVWTERPAMIATRVDGEPHSRRERGPLQFVFPMDADPTTATHEFESYWVWMAARIERVR